ncbi:DUF3047 domain-containing protein [Pandoraea pulmonicola]|uniref:Protein of uncharacterized function (DUF3047) n=1 Tax=Pandoraea pulmonicola TaxID=93221 RepID=A0AAJ5D2G4_PANPU|nr:DUF3047 domain-containing protein [Pandoraea pulmonicola]SUA92555.1 Protein of uncharacterised function (DUF3047) [Pandoraea pulmonicola]
MARIASLPHPSLYSSPGSSSDPVCRRPPSRVFVAWLSRRARTFAVTLVLSFCASLLPRGVALAAEEASQAGAATAFSRATPGAALPTGWQNLPVVKGKKLTAYTVVVDGGRNVIEANSVDSASALMAKGDGIDLGATPVVSWRWKVDQAIPGADNRVRDKEDSPARLVFFFDGDKSTLPFGDRAAMTLARAGGEDLPYATLMYIWSNDAAPGGVIQNPHTDRVQMIVVAGGEASLGKWQTFTRNLAADYERVYKEKPGKLLGYGIFTDSDNTHASAHAWYGDMRFSPAKPSER